MSGNPETLRFIDEKQFMYYHLSSPHVDDSHWNGVVGKDGIMTVSGAQRTDIYAHPAFSCEDFSS